MKIICLLLCLHYHTTCAAQEEEKIKDVIEATAEKQTEEDDLFEISDRLQYFRKHPIRLNRTTPEELKSLFLLSPLQISNFFNYTSRNQILDVLEIQAIPGFDTETVNRILPFITLVNTSHYSKMKLDDMLHDSNHDLIFRYSSLLQQQKGFKDLPGSRYTGSPEKLLIRYRYDFQQLISAAVVMEKDAGEKIFNNKGGPDHLSAHVAFFKIGRIKKLVIGDYSMQFGQGLTLWSGFSFGKGPDVTSVAAKDIGLKPYTSANEASFFRGTAGTIFLGKKIYFSPFFSARKLDASLKALPGGNFSVSNINISGLHRTQTELKNRKSLKQLVYGGVFQYLSDHLNIGVIGYLSHYGHQFVTGSQPYNKYAFQGQDLGNTGMHYNYTFKNIYMYGEIAHSIGSGKAMVNGAMASLSSRISAVIFHRSYDKAYHNFFSRAIGEGSETNNENGWYAGLNFLLPRKLTLSLYGDYFRFPWLKYRVDAPSSGYEMLTQLSYARTKTFKALLRYKRELKQQNMDQENHHLPLDHIVRESYRFAWSLSINEKLNLQQRLEVSNYQKGMSNKEKGYLAYQDVSYAPLSSKVSCNLRLAVFRTTSYNTRIYAYEDNVLYSSGSSTYAGKGFRTYVNARYQASKNADIWVRYSAYFYRGGETIGTGLDEIEGKNKSEIKLQLRYQF